MNPLLCQPSHLFELGPTHLHKKPEKARKEKETNRGRSKEKSPHTLKVVTEENVTVTDDGVPRFSYKNVDLRPNSEVTDSPRGGGN